MILSHTHVINASAVHSSWLYRSDTPGLYRLSAAVSCITVHPSEHASVDDDDEDEDDDDTSWSDVTAARPQHLLLGGIGPCPTSTG